MFVKKNIAENRLIVCLTAVIKKYLPRVIFYPLVIASGYKVLIYAISNDLDLTYSFVASYTSVILIMAMAIEFMQKILTYDLRGTPSRIIQDDSKTDERTLKIKSQHEAGHFFMAKTLDLPVKEVNIIENGNTGGQLILDMPNILTEGQIKNLVKVKYAGVLAEKILGGEASNGCVGYETSDIESANYLLKQYILLTDDSLSLTGYEDDYIKNKSIALSKLLVQEVSEVLSANKQEISEIAEELLINNFIKVA